MLAASRAAVVGVLVFACFDVGHAGRRRVMPWLCLERCNASAVQSDLAQVREHASVLTAVSYEAFNLGPDAGFVDNGFTRANTSLRDLGLELYPMITSANIEYMRTLFGRPDGFISAAVAEALSSNFVGYNVDFEPCQYEAVCTAADAQAYAVFLGKLADALHAHGFRLTADVASWSPFFNFTAVAAAGIDRLITMDTYASSFDYFNKTLHLAASVATPARVGAGLCNSCSKVPLNKTQVLARLDAISEVGVQEIDIWMMPLDDEVWWPSIAAWVRGG